MLAAVGRTLLHGHLHSPDPGRPEARLARRTGGLLSADTAAHFRTDAVIDPIRSWVECWPSRKFEVRADCHQQVRYGTSSDCFRLQRAPPSGHRAGRWSHCPTAVRRAAVWCILQAVALFRIRVAAMKPFLFRSSSTALFHLFSKRLFSGAGVWRATSKGSPSV